jgi:multidrug efflux pump subunit AcrA (membrane-fusion protein)
MRFLGRALVGLAMTAATLALLGLAAATLRDAAGGGEAAAPRGLGEERAFAAAVVRAAATTVSPQLALFGEVRAVRRLELRSPRAGTVQSLAPGFGEGAAMAAGTRLMQLDPADALAARDIARADLAEAEAAAAEAAAALALARDDLAAAASQAALRRQALDRQTDLSARGVGSDQAVEAAQLLLSGAEQAVLSRRAAVVAAEARVAVTATQRDRRRIALAEAERALAETALAAPFAGVLADVAVVPGRIVAQNERIADLVDPAALEVAIRVPVTDFARLTDAAGAVLPLAVTARPAADSPERDVARGRLARVGATVETGRSGRLVFAVLADPARLRPGDFVEVTVSEPPLEGVVDLPAAALGPDGTVLALGAGDRLEALPVRLLRRQGDRVILAASGLAGREVVAERAPVLGAGIRVRPVRAGDDSGAALIEPTPERRAVRNARVEAGSRGG